MLKLPFFREENNDIIRIDGQQAGQILTIICVAGTNTPAGTLTPQNLNGYNTIAFNAVGDSVTLMFHNSNWNVIAQNSVTLAN